MSALVFIINGRPRAGKDTLAGFMDKALQQLGYAPTHYSSIDPVRNVLNEMGLNVTKKTAADRMLLATVGAAVEEHSHFRSKGCIDAVQKAILTLFKPAVFMMIREPHIIERVRQELVNRGNCVFRVMVHSDRSEAPTNETDAGVNDMPFDLLVHNFGTLEDLEAEAISLINLVHMRKDVRNAG